MRFSLQVQEMGDALADWKELDKDDEEVHNGASKILEAEDTEMATSSSYGASLIENYSGSKSDVLQHSFSCEPETGFSLWNSRVSGSYPSASFLMKSNYADQDEKSWSTNSIRSSVLSQIHGCNRTEYKRFAILYQNLTKIARAYVLTPERMDFGIITNKSLLFDLGIGRMQNYTWFLMMRMLDQPHTPRFYFENETVGSFISGSEQLVPELDHDMVNHHTSFSNGSPSIILFIDRATLSQEVRKKSWEALKAFQAVARESVGPENFEVQDLRSGDSNFEAKQASKDWIYPIKSVVERAMSNGLPNLKGLLSHGTSPDAAQSSMYQSGSSEDKPSSKDHSVRGGASKQDANVVLKILLEGEEKIQIGASLPDISPEKLQDLDIKRMLLSENNAIYEVQEGKIVGKVDTDVIRPFLMGVESPLSTNPHPSVGRETLELTRKGIEHSTVDATEERLIEKEESGDPSYKNALFYFFADGEDQLKDMILPGLPYPSLVILDPSEGGQFVFPVNDQSINYSSLKAFVNQFARSSLQRIYRSEPAPQSPRKQVQPPFVNRNFHEVNGVPRVTVETFSQMVLGYQAIENMSDAHFEGAQGKGKEEMDSAWNRDVLVHFTTPSCGFCKRMELVFREVHQLLTLHLDKNVRHTYTQQSTKQPQPMTDVTGQFQDGQLIEGSCADSCWFGLKDKLPLLFQMDCTTNDCSAFFKGIDQEELYPSTILFPGRRKDPPIIFEGGPTVQEILEFLAVKGNVGTKIIHAFQGISRNKRLNAKPKTPMGCFFPSLSSQPIQIDSSAGGARQVYHFTADTTNEIPSSKSFMLEVGTVNNHDSMPIIYPTVGSVLVATKKVSKASTVFESSSILIVKADGQEGFQGLIFNKPLSWKLLPGMDSEMERIVNSTVLCYGGPVILHGQPFLSLSRLKDLEGFSEVVPGVHFGGPSVTMHVLQSIKDSKLEACDFWFFFGHAVWSWQQLLDELAAQVWQLAGHEEGTLDLPIQEWLNGSSVSVSDLLKTRTKE